MKNKFQHTLLTIAMLLLHWVSPVSAELLSQAYKAEYQVYRDGDLLGTASRALDIKDGVYTLKIETIAAFFFVSGTWREECHLKRNHDTFKAAGYKSYQRVFMSKKTLGTGLRLGQKNHHRSKPEIFFPPSRRRHF